MIGPQSVRLVGRLYDTALDEKAWSDLSTEIARGFDGNSGVVQVQTAEKGSWTEYRAVVPLEADVRADGDIGIIGIHRPRRSGPFNAAAKQELQFLLPHVQRALQIRQRLSSLELGRQASLEALARAQTATMVVLRDSRILYANPEAEALLQTGDGLRSMHGRLTSSDSRSGRRLAALIQGAADTAAAKGASPGGVIAIAREGHFPLTVLIAPFGRPVMDLVPLFRPRSFHPRSGTRHADDTGIANVIRSDSGRSMHCWHVGRGTIYGRCSSPSEHCS